MPKNKILFIHHSTGANLLKEGKVRELLYSKSSNIELWDHSYNLYPILPKLFSNIGTFHTGLSDANGKYTGTDYNITISNNSPKEYYEIFSRNESDPTLSKILQYDMVVFKNCFPITKIVSDTLLREDMKYFLQIKTALKKYPNKKFVVFTPPPLRAECTKPEYAKRARDLEMWMMSSDYLSDTKTKNLKVFDFYNYLADSNNMLKKEYTRWLYLDSHPNKKANEEVGKLFMDFLVKTINTNN